MVHTRLVTKEARTHLLGYVERYNSLNVTKMLITAQIALIEAAIMVTTATTTRIHDFCTFASGVRSDQPDIFPQGALIKLLTHEAQHYMHSRTVSYPSLPTRATQIDLGLP